MSNKGYETIKTDKGANTGQFSHPTTSASFLSLLTFWWMNSIFAKGNKRPLNQTDFLPLHEEDRTRDLTERLQREWNNDVQESNKTRGRQPKLWKCVLRTIARKEIIFLVSVWLVESLCRLSQPLLLGFLLGALSSAQVDISLVCACCLLLASAGLSTACTHYSAYRFELFGMRLSSALKGIVYLKVRAATPMPGSHAPAT